MRLLLFAPFVLFTLPDFEVVLERAEGGPLLNIYKLQGDSVAKRERLSNPGCGGSLPPPSPPQKSKPNKWHKKLFFRWLL